jgi:hypothetical protein
LSFVFPPRHSECKSSILVPGTYYVASPGSTLVQHGSSLDQLCAYPDSLMAQSFFFITGSICVYTVPYLACTGSYPGLNPGHITWHIVGLPARKYVNIYRSVPDSTVNCIRDSTVNCIRDSTVNCIRDSNVNCIRTVFVCGQYSALA